MGEVKGTVLIVEDDEDIARYMAVHLRTAGWETVVTENAHQALDWLAANERPDVVLTGWMMPGMKGIELTRRVSSQENAPPIVICTAKWRDSAGAEGFAAGAAAFIHKPFDAPALVDVIDRVAHGETGIGPIKPVGQDHTWTG